MLSHAWRHSVLVTTESYQPREMVAWASLWKDVVPAGAPPRAEKTLELIYTVYSCVLSKWIHTLSVAAYSVSVFIQFYTPFVAVQL